MNQRFEFEQLFPVLQWEVIMRMEDPELVNLCRSSHTMENFCNTKDWFWKERIKVRFELDPLDSTIQNILTVKGNWFRVYLTLVRLNKLWTKGLNSISCSLIYNEKLL